MSVSEMLRIIGTSSIFKISFHFSITFFLSYMVIFICKQIYVKFYLDRCMFLPRNMWYELKIRDKQSDLTVSQFVDYWYIKRFCKLLGNCIFWREVNDALHENSAYHFSAYGYSISIIPCIEFTLKHM